MKNKKLLLGILYCLIIIIYIYVNEVDEKILTKRYSNKYYYGEAGTIVYFVDDVVNVVKSMKPISNRQIENTINNFIESKEVRYYFETEDLEKPQNIVLIQLEGIDGVTLDLMYDGTYIMPTLKALSEQGIYFPNAYDQSGVGRTSDAEFLALTSLLPIENECMYLKYELDNLFSLPKALSLEGYSTISLHGYEGSYYSRRINHAALGYQQSFFLEDMQLEATEGDYWGWGLSDEYVLAYAKRLVCEQEQNVFAHVILLTNHHPFGAIPNDFPYLLISEPKTIVENYINSVHYTDYVIGEFLKGLEESGELEDSLVVVYSDHDSAITQDVYSYFDLEYDVNNKKVHDKLLLLMYDAKQSKVDELVMGQADIAPLVLSYIGVDIPECVMGMNYVEERKVVYTQGKDIYSDTEMKENQLDMELITKSYIYGQEE